MVKSYCVKEKKQTECVPGSERYVKTENGRTMMKCQCISCGITKSKFVKSQSTGSGIRTGGNVTLKPYCGARKVPKGRYYGNIDECKNQVRYYGLNQIDPIMFERRERDKKNVKKVVSKENIKQMKDLNKKSKELKKIQKQLGLN